MGFKIKYRFVCVNFFFFLSFSEPIAKILYSDLLKYGTISAASLSPDASPVMIKIFFFNL